MLVSKTRTKVVHKNVSQGLKSDLLSFEIILIKMKYLRIYNVSVHRNFYQNQLINKCARKKIAKIPEFFCEI